MSFCRSCGAQTKGTRCGACNRAAMAAAMLGYTYRRTHVHQWPDGRRTVEAGPECGDGCDT